MILREALLSAGAVEIADVPDAYSLGVRFLADVRRGEKWEERQERVLDALREAVTLPWFLGTAEPEDFVAWPRVSPTTLSVPDDQSGWSILNSAGVYLGSWTLYAAEAPVELNDMPDPFKTAARAQEWVASKAISALLSSWPDDTNWVLYLGPGLSQRKLSAPD